MFGQVSAYYACINILSHVLTWLPWRTFLVMSPALSLLFLLFPLPFSSLLFAWHSSPSSCSLCFPFFQLCTCCFWCSLDCRNRNITWISTFFLEIWACPLQLCYWDLLSYCCHCLSSCYCFYWGPINMVCQSLHGIHSCLVSIRTCRMLHMLMNTYEIVWNHINRSCKATSPLKALLSDGHHLSSPPCSSPQLPHPTSCRSSRLISDSISHLATPEAKQEFLAYGQYKNVPKPCQA